MKMAHSLSSKSVSAELKRKSLGLIQVPSNMHHKGSSGRVVVIGGSRDYTGAPYFSAISAMRSGVDMATIVTTSAAAQSLKALSPDLIVRGIIPSPPPSTPSSNLFHGVLSGNASQHHRHIALPHENMRTSEEHCEGGKKKEEEELQSYVVSRHLIGEITELLSKSHALIIGPGLASASMTVTASASSSSKSSSSGKAHRLSKEEFAGIQKAGFGEEMCPLFVEWLRYYVSDGTYTCSSPHTSSSSSSSFTDLKALRTVPCIIDATGLSLLADALACRRRILSTSTNTTQEKKEEGGIDIIKPQETASDLSSSSSGSTGLPPIILTPNINEIKILYQAALRSSESVEEDDEEKKGVAHANHPEEMAVYVSKVMHCCVLLKGFHDFIAVEGVAFGHVTMDLPDWETNGGDGKTKRTKEARGADDNDDKDLTPCPRRVAGQGDVLSGLVGAFLAWQHIHKKMSFGGGNTSDSGGSSDIVISQMLAINATAEVAIGASLAMKHCCRLTEASAGTRRFLVSDIIGCVSKTVDLLAHPEN